METLVINSSLKMTIKEYSYQSTEVTVDFEKGFSVENHHLLCKVNLESFNIYTAMAFRINYFSYKIIKDIEENQDIIFDLLNEFCDKFDENRFKKN